MKALALPVIDDGIPVVAIRNLCVHRGGRAVLHNLTCDLARGKITAVIGLNGCGKSTLLRTLVGEFSYTGTLRFACGEDHRKPRPDHVGYVPQRLMLEAAFPITVRDLLGLALQRRPLIFGVSKKVVQRMRPVLQRVGIEDRLDVPIDGLSGGQLQRVLLALALDPQPELLLLDEPTAGIDFKDMLSFYDLIGDINRESGVTIVIVSHDLALVKRLAHHVLCVRDGHIVRQGPPSEVLTSDAVDETFGHGSMTLSSSSGIA